MIFLDLFVKTKGKCPRFIVDIMSDREMMKKLITFLNDDCGILYVEIQKFFEMSRRVLNDLRDL